MFQIGQLYSRKDHIHKTFRGQQQGGISTPKNSEFIFLFTGASGEHFGYEDGWNEGGVFLYTGEGQRGDMTFKVGNLAIRDASKNGKTLLLFQTTGKGRPVRFLGTFACGSWDWIETADVEGHKRQAIQFHLVPTSEAAGSGGPSETEPLPNEAIESLRTKAFRAAEASNAHDWKQSVQTFRTRSKAVRDYVLARANGTCELTGQPAPFTTPAGVRYLEVHHTRRLSDNGPDDPRYVAAIHPVVHREIHFGARGTELNDKLKSMLKDIEPRDVRKN